MGITTSPGSAVQLHSLQVMSFRPNCAVPHSTQNFPEFSVPQKHFHFPEAEAGLGAGLMLPQLWQNFFVFSLPQLGQIQAAEKLADVAVTFLFPTILDATGSEEPADT